MREYPINLTADEVNEVYSALIGQDAEYGLKVGEYRLPTGATVAECRAAYDAAVTRGDELIEKVRQLKDNAAELEPLPLPFENPPCPDCRGTGGLGAENDCPRCGGNGVI